MEHCAPFWKGRQHSSRILGDFRLLAMYFAAFLLVFRPLALLAFSHSCHLLLFLFAACGTLSSISICSFKQKCRYVNIVIMLLFNLVPLEDLVHSCSAVHQNH